MEIEKNISKLDDRDNSNSNSIYTELRGEVW